MVDVASLEVVKQSSVLRFEGSELQRSHRWPLTRVDCSKDGEAAAVCDCFESGIPFHRSSLTRQNNIFIRLEQQFRSNFGHLIKEPHSLAYSCRQWDANNRSI